jgi:hypothetical protein
MDRNELIQIRSEEVQDIISRSPSWMLQWGILLIFFVFVALLGASWFIKYPDVITASVEVTTDPSPVFLVSGTAGKIKLLKEENAQLHEGDLIGYIQSNTLPDVVGQLQGMVDQYQIDNNLQQFYTDLSQLVNAGDLQSHVNNVRRTVGSLLIFQNTKLYEKQVSHLEKQIRSYRKLSINLHAQLNLQEQETALTAQSFSGDSLLYAQRSIPAFEFRQSKSALLTQLRSLKSMEASIVANELQIETLQKQVMELRVARTKEERELKAGLSYAISELVATAATWSGNYLFRAPADGRLAYISFLEDEQYVDSGPLFALLPESGALIAKGELPIDGAGKVKEGQSVNIRLNNYPEVQFGTISGVVQSISLLPNKDKYRLVIGLPEGLRSSYNSELGFQPLMSGQTEIITEDLRLLERFFYQLRALVQ